MAKKSDQSTDNDQGEGPKNPNMSGYASPVRDSGLEGSWTPEFDNVVFEAGPVPRTQDAILKK